VRDNLTKQPPSRRVQVLGQHLVKAESAKYTTDGTCASGFEAVAAAFEQNFELGQERNAQLCVYYKNQCVVDMWGSAEPAANASKDKPVDAPAAAYGPETLQMVFSSSKVVTAICIAMCVDRGLLSYSEKVAAYWPEFGQNGKENITVSNVLQHEAGLVRFDQFVSREQLEVGVCATARRSLPTAWPQLWHQRHRITRSAVPPDRRSSHSSLVALCLCAGSRQAGARDRAVAAVLLPLQAHARAGTVGLTAGRGGCQGAGAPRLPRHYARPHPRLPAAPRRPQRCSQSHQTPDTRHQTPDTRHQTTDNRQQTTAVASPPPAVPSRWPPTAIAASCATPS